MDGAGVAMKASWVRRSGGCSSHRPRGARLHRRKGQSIFGAVLGRTLVIVSDAHLGVAAPGTEQALLEFLDAVPTLGDCLLINGDLFDFWFTYSRVIPRRGFHVAAALAGLRRRVPIVMVGGNHDRWDRDFWARDLGLSFSPHRATFEIGRRTVTAIHGDGLAQVVQPSGDDAAVQLTRSLDDLGETQGCDGRGPSLSKARRCDGLQCRCHFLGKAGRIADGAVAQHADACILAERHAHDVEPLALR